MKPKLSAELSMETFGFRADGGARNKPLHDCSNERAAEADECCEDFGRHVIGGEVSQMANARLTEQILLAAFLLRSAKKVTAKFVRCSRLLVS